jgi:predicted secreted protein
MNWVIGIATYVVIWWIVIFAVLPFGVRPANEGELGHDAGAPANPRLPLKAAITSVVALILWLLVDWAVNAGLVNFRGP